MRRQQKAVTWVIKLSLCLCVYVFVCLGMSSSKVLEAARSGSISNLDLTKGEKIPKDANHDWNLGPIGVRGWMYSHKMGTHQARQIAVTKVAQGSPADGVLEVGDVILGVGGKKFSYDPRTEMGKAISLAETQAKAGKLSLIVWRKGREQTLAIKLPVMGSYSQTAPYGCEKSKRLLVRGAAALAARMGRPDYRGHPIVRSMNALGLLATGEAKYLPLVKREATWASTNKPGGYVSWSYGYMLIFLSEYVMATGDQSVVPGLRRLSLEAARGQSAVGSWGHRFVMSTGRLGGYGMMNSPGIPLTTGLALAVKAGVKDKEVVDAVEKSAKLLRFYAGKGAIPYGDHAPWIQTHEDNGKCGMAAVLFNQLGESDRAEFFSRMAIASHGPERDGGHTGNFFNMIWAMPSVALSGQAATGAWMNEFGGWYYDLSRQHDGTFIHQGPPAVRKDSYKNWDCTGAYLLAYALPLKKIHLTGKQSPIVPQLSNSQAQGLIEDGRGWTNWDREGFYNGLSEQALLKRLRSWSPIVRLRAAQALQRKKANVIPQLMKMLASADLYAQLGACEALAKFRGAAAPAMKPLIGLLNHDHMWLRIRAIEALAAMGQAGMPALPNMLQLLADRPRTDDPRGMEHRYLCFALFNRRGGMLSRSLEGVDRQALYAAVRSGLRNQDGRARGSVSGVYSLLSFEEIKPLLPSIIEAIRTPAPSGIMFADAVQTNGLKLLSKHRVDEAMEMIADYVKTQKAHGSQKRIVQILKMLKPYGAHAKRVIPILEANAKYFEGGEENFPKKLSKDKAKLVREVIEQIKASKETPKLTRLNFKFS